MAGEQPIPLLMSTLESNALLSKSDPLPPPPPTKQAGAAADGSSSTEYHDGIGKTDEIDWFEKTPEEEQSEREEDEEDLEEQIEDEESCFPLWNRLSPAGQWIFVNLILVVGILLPIGLITKFAFADPAIGHVPVSLWCIFISITVISLGLCRLFVYLCLQIAKLRLRQLRYVERIQLVESLQGWITLAIWSLVNLALWVYILNNQRARNYTVTRIFTGLVFSSIAFFFKSLAFHSFVSGFHELAFKDRITKLKFAQYVLDTLREARKKSMPSPMAVIASKITFDSSDPQGSADTVISLSRDSPPRSPPAPPTNAPTTQGGLAHPVSKNPADGTLRPLYNSFVSSVPISLDFVKLPGEFLLDDKSGAGISASETTKADMERAESRRLAKKLFEWICPDDKAEIDIEQFYQIFPRISIAKRAFAIFDTNGQGGISAIEMRSSVSKIFQEQRHLSQSIEDMHKALSKLNLVLTIVTVVVLLFVWLIIFGIDLSSVFVTLTTLLVIMNYFIGANLSNTFTSILFMFVTHPYDVGDVIQVQQSGAFYTFTVMEMNILTTTLKRDDGLMTIVPNNDLSHLFIYNVRRSAPQSHSIALEIPFDTDFKKIAEIRAALAAWVLTEHRDFTKSYVLAIDADGSRYTIKLVIGVVHKDNFQDGGKVGERKQKFVTKVKELLEIAQILPSAPPASSHIVLSKDAEELLGAAFART
ncbi:hypothetical protein HDU93_009743 [Gonapodya sp. JEL0774]|nr:hypothetical protein HDU93_009743 [Gonapodya sp. JEL0774]